MSPHLSRERAEEYRHRVLAEADLLAVDKHLAACEECRHRISANVDLEAAVSDFHRRLISDVRPLESDHLSYEQVVKLVDDDLKQHERDELETHVEACESCAADVNDLRAFRKELLNSTPQKTARALRPSFSEKIRSLIDGQALSFRSAFAAALALLLIAAFVAIYLGWRASRRSQQVLEASRPVPEASPEANSSNVATAPSPSQESTSDENFVVTLEDGGKRVTVDVNGNVEGLVPLAGASSQAVRRALTTGKVAVPDLSELIGVKGRLMGTSDGSAFALMNPVGTVSRNTRPTLRWRPLTGATSYTVAILDDSYNVVTTSPPVMTTSWTTSIPLSRGKVYSWQVTALKDGKEIISPSAPSPEARFKVLDKAMVDELGNAEKLSGNSHLVRGTLYAKAGMLDEAEREIRALVAANPNSQRARQLLQSIGAVKSKYEKPD